MEEKLHQVREIYDAFETDAAGFKTDAACEKGCAYCCTDAGRIDITTLEGMAIRAEIRRLPRPLKLKAQKDLARDMKKREKGQSNPCPFLMKNRGCLIYNQRPFSCRRIYSLHKCNAEQAPVLHRPVMKLADDTIRRLQILDDTGYTGHISFILFMMDKPKFLKNYLSGEHRPEEIVQFGKAHRIIINRMAQHNVLYTDAEGGLSYVK
jgi:Fe-S-cluster containining protein